MDIYGRDEGDVGDKEASNLWRRSDGKGQLYCGKPAHDVIWIIAKVVQSLFLVASPILREWTRGGSPIRGEKSS